MSYPWNLPWFGSGEAQVIREHLDEMEKLGIDYHPPRRDLFKALSAIRPENVKVLMMGQDPYPNAAHATGLAFSVPSFLPPSSFPPTLKIIFNELVSNYPDMPYPTTGNLQHWVDEGVLLWNSSPVFSKKFSLLKCPEWVELTRDILRKLEDNNLVIATLGAAAKSHLVAEDYQNFKVINVGHPSPRGNINSGNPFSGSRLFQRINTALSELGQTPINWRLS
jgi:uracil-DNA glycosylase